MTEATGGMVCMLWSFRVSQQGHTGLEQMQK